MFSIRRTSIVLVTGAAALFADGCTKKANSQPNVSVEPQVIDAAMAKRDWPQSVSLIPNGSAVAGDTGFAYEPTRGKNRYTYYYADSGVFLLNVVTLPYTFVRNGIAQPQTFPGERTNPTFTAVPPLPPQPASEAPEPAPQPPATQESESK